MRKPNVRARFADTLLSGLDGEARLAAATWTDQGQQTAGWVVQAAGDASHLFGAADKRGGLGWQVVPWCSGCLYWWCDLPHPNLLVQRRCLRFWFDAQLLRKETTATLILRQRRCPMASAGQARHHPAVRGFALWIQLQQTPGVCESRFVRAVIQVMGHQLVQRLHHQPSQPLLLHAHPLFETAAGAHVKARQEIPPVKR